MKTVLMLGPADHGRPITREEFDAARGQEGYRYELIEGKVYVSPVPNLPHDFICEWVDSLLDGYRRTHPENLNYLSGKARVYVPGEEESTSPEPDLAGYRGFPHHLPLSDLSWEDVSPILVAEVVSDDNPDKDLVRNVELYLRVPSIREYWIFDPRQDPDRPTLRVYRRRGNRWQRPIDLAPGETYTTPLLPDFALLLDPHAEGTQP
jgi:Uma2 family endonuclease